MSMDVGVEDDADLHAKIARLMQENENLKLAMQSLGSTKAKSDENDIAADSMSDAIDAKGDAFQPELRQELSKILARFPPTPQKEAFEEAFRKVETVEITAAAGNDENSLLTLPSLTVNKEERKIYHNDSEIRMELKPTNEYMNGLLEKVSKAKLINDKGMMDEASLLALVQGATRYSCQRFRPQRAAQSTNMIQENLDGASNCGEMFLQQVVFSPIAELFSCFDLRKYCADKLVACAHTVPSKTEKKEKDWYRVGCLPDAAIRLTDHFYLIAMMELKAHSKINAEDLFRCKLMTCLSLLVFGEYLHSNGFIEKQEDVNMKIMKGAKPADQSSDKLTFKDLALPFVMGSNAKAYLFVTRFEMVNDEANLVFTHIKTLRFCTENIIHSGEVEYKPQDDVKKKVEFMSILAILVADIFAIAATFSEGFGDDFIIQETQIGEKLPSAFRGSTGSRDKTKSGSNSQSTETTNKKQKSGGTNSNPSAHEVAARHVASLNGKIQKLDYPWPRVGYWNLDATKQEQWEADMAFYMQESPFYFSGMYGSTEVFCKVWREGDPRTCRQDILEEIDFNFQANKSCVPSCKIIKDLTRMDICPPLSPDFGGALSGSKYHLMVSEYHGNDEVAEEDVLDFAKLLVEAVLTLHGIGVLHCDIKRSNILWDAKAKVVRLVDFGLAQKEVNAQSYHATRKYEAPEIGEKHPHSRMSDAYSVGKTIAKVIQEGFDKPVVKEVMNVAKLLQCHDVSHRLSLERAKSMLVALKEPPSTARTKRQYENVQHDDGYSLMSDNSYIFDPAFDDKNIVATAFEKEGKNVHCAKG